MINSIIIRKLGPKHPSATCKATCVHGRRDMAWCGALAACFTITTATTVLISTFEREQGNKREKQYQLSKMMMCKLIGDRQTSTDKRWRRKKNEEEAARGDRHY